MRVRTQTVFERPQHARVRDERARSRCLGEVRQHRAARYVDGKDPPFVALSRRRALPRENRQQRAKHLRHREHRIVVVDEQSHLRQSRRASARDVRPEVTSAASAARETASGLEPSPNDG